MADLVDPGRLLVAALRDTLGKGVQVVSAVDSEVPLGDRTVVVQPVTGTPALNGPPDQAGIWTVSIQALARKVDDAHRLAGSVFACVTGLECQTVRDIGFVSTVDVVLLPTMAPVSLPNIKTFAQYSMQFTIRLRPITK